MKGNMGSASPPRNRYIGPVAKSGRPPKLEPPRKRDGVPKDMGLAGRDLASIVWEPWQDPWYMELNVGCLSRKLLANSAGFSYSPYSRIAKLGLDALAEIMERLEWPSKVNVNVTKVGTSESVPGEEFVRLTVVEKDRPMGEFVAPRMLFEGCSWTINFSLSRHRQYQ